MRLLPSRETALLVAFIILLVLFKTSAAAPNEGFTPRIRETYRPWIRSARVGFENIYSRWSKYISAKLGRYT